MFDNYKTSNKKGTDSLELNPKSQQVLISHLELFIKDFRSYLLEKWSEKHQKTGRAVLKDAKYVFVSSKSTADQFYSDSSWSAMVCNIFKQKTGMNVSINMIRSSFVTYFYSSEASNSQCMRESIASGMRHSINEAQKTYDRRYNYFIFLFPTSLSSNTDTLLIKKKP